jgi:hypothetical protein
MSADDFIERWTSYFDGIVKERQYGFANPQYTIYRGNYTWG